MSDDDITYYEESFTQLRERLIRVLGLPTVNRLIDRAVAEIRHVHPAVAALRFDDDSVQFDDFRRELASQPATEARDAYAALTGVLLLLVARLLGREIASRLTEDLTVAEYLNAQGIT